MKMIIRRSAKNWDQHPCNSFAYNVSIVIVVEVGGHEDGVLGDDESAMCH